LSWKNKVFIQVQSSRVHSSSPPCLVGGCHRTGVKPYRLTGTEGPGSLPRLAPLNRV